MMRTNKKKQRDNFHETHRDADIDMPSEKSTGLVFAGVFTLIGLFNTHRYGVLALCLGLALALVVVSFFMPRMLKPLNIVWFKLSLLLSKIVNPIVMGVLFVVLIVPFGLVMQLWYDPLRRRAGRKLETYWLEVDDTDKHQSSMRNQF